MVTDTSAVRYHDLLFRIILSLVAAHLVVAFGEKDTFFQLLVLWDYWRSLCFSFIIAFVLVSIVYLCTCWLDFRFHWTTKTLARAGLQTVLGLVLPAVIAFLLADVYFRLYHISIFQTIYLKFDYPVVVLMLLLLNVYYVAFYFFRQWQLSIKIKSDNAPSPVKTVTTDVYIVSKGSDNIPLPFISISYFYHEGQYNFVRTFEGQDYLVPDTLDYIEGILPLQLFFRANRQIIINRHSCEKFENAYYGKLKIYLKPHYISGVIISQKKAGQFKIWIGKNAAPVYQS